MVCIIVRRLPKLLASLLAMGDALGDAFGDAFGAEQGVASVHRLVMHASFRLE